MQGAETSGRERYLVCEVGEALYALPLHEVARTKPMDRLGAVPASVDPSLVGLTADGGRVLQVFDLSARLGAAPPTSLSGGYILILRRGRFGLRTAVRPLAAHATRAEDGEHLHLDDPSSPLHGRIATALSFELLFPPSTDAQLESVSS